MRELCLFLLLLLCFHSLLCFHLLLPLFFRSQLAATAKNSTSSIDLLLSDDKTKGQRTYNVNFYNDILITTVTHVTSVVDNWIKKIEEFHHNILDGLIIGLDVDKPSRNPLAILKLCVGKHCLIYQFLFAGPSMPESLIRFLDNSKYKFFGVGIRDDVFRLEHDYGLNVRPDNMIDLRELAVEKHRGDLSFGNLGLNELAYRFLAGKVIEMPEDVLTSDWSVEFLSEGQVQYACIDAFVCFDIGRVLMSGSLVHGNWIALH